MMSVAIKYKVPNVEQTISEELARTLSTSEVDEFCGTLSKTLKQLPESLSTKTLEPFGSIPTCVRSCYTKDYQLEEVCRALLAGYKLIPQSIGKEESKQQLHQLMQVPADDKADSIKHISEDAKIVPAVAKVKIPAADEIKGKSPIPVSVDTEKSDKKITLDEHPISAVIPNVPSGDIMKTKELEGKGKDSAIGEVDAAAPKTAEKAQKESIPSPGQLPLEEPVAPEKIDGDLEQQQGGMDGVAGDLAPFDDEPKQAVEQDAKGGTPPVYENSDESEAIASAEDVNENGDDLEINGYQPVAKPDLSEKLKQDEFAGSSKASDIVPGADPFYEQKDSNFFSYFLFAMFSCAMLYVAYHNKSKLLALVVEGRRTSSGRGGFSKGRKHTAAYRKLDSNLEEAITSGSGSGAHSSSQIIY
uniref:Uncharacterized protein n=1 Tax=Anopheles christyi TaxID=43041 RepID=A0A182K2K5_9DIPT